MARTKTGLWPVGLTKLGAPSVLTVKTESSPWSNDGPLVYKLGLIIVKSSQNKGRVYEGHCAHHSGPSQNSSVHDQL